MCYIFVLVIIMYMVVWGHPQNILTRDDGHVQAAVVRERLPFSRGSGLLRRRYLADDLGLLLSTHNLISDESSPFSFMSSSSSILLVSSSSSFVLHLSPGMDSC